MKAGLTSAIAIAWTGLLLGTAHAQTANQKPTVQPSSWIVTVRGNIGVSPEWEGSDSYSFFGYPSMSFRRSGEKPIWKSPDDSVSYAFPVTDAFSVGPVILYRSGRYTDNDKRLAGIHDARWTLEPGIFMQVWVVPDTLRMKVEIRRGFREKDGFIADFAADWVNHVDQWTFAIGPRLSIADGNFMRYRFGVTEFDALQNPRVTAYKATSGLKSAGVLASLSYTFNEQWDGTVYGGYSRLLGDAADSPITRQFGSRDQWTLGAKLGYSFNFSGF